VLRREIKCLVDHVKTKLPIFGDNGFYIDHFADYENGINGVTDTLGDAYFFIQLKKRLTADEFKILHTADRGQDQVLAVYQLVAGLGCVNIREAVHAIYNALMCSPDLNIAINSISTNSDLIYNNLYGDEKADDGINLIQFEFTAQDMLLESSVCTLEICEDCCAVEGKTGCNCD